MALEEKVRVREEAIYESTTQEYRQAFVRSLIDKSISRTPLSWERLPTNQQQLVNEYVEKASKTWQLYYKIEKETEKHSLSLDEWQKVCEERNALASDLMKTLSKELILEILGEKYVETLKTQISQHKKMTKIKENENSLSPSPSNSIQLLQAEKKPPKLQPIHFLLIKINC